MKAAVIVAFGALVMSAGVGLLTSAQEAPLSNTPQPKTPPANILLKLTEPAQTAPADAVTRDDLRELAPPRIDTLSDGVRFHVVVSDPRCLPGEDLGLDPARLRPPSRRR